MFEKPTLDSCHINELRESLNSDEEEDIFKQLSELYLNKTPEQFEYIKEHISKKDNSLLRAEAHKLKTSSNNLGAMKMSDYFKQIEANCKEDNVNWDLIKSLLEKAESEFINVKKEINVFLVDIDKKNVV